MKSPKLFWHFPAGQFHSKAPVSADFANTGYTLHIQIHTYTYTRIGPNLGSQVSEKKKKIEKRRRKGKKQQH